MCLMTQLGGLNKGCLDSLWYDAFPSTSGESKFGESSTLFSPADCFLIKDLGTCYILVLGGIRVAQRKVLGVGFPTAWMHEVHHRSSRIVKFIGQQFVEILVQNLCRADFQIWDPGVNLSSSWIHRVIRLDSDRSLSCIQEWLVGVLFRIIWDLGGR